MKNRVSYDKRVIQSNGQTSQSRVAVIEALEAQGTDGATIDDLAILIGAEMPGEHPKKSIGHVLHNMQRDEYVVEWRGRWYLTEHHPQNKQPPPAAPPVSSNGHQAVAPHTAKRTGRVVSVFVAPVIFTDVVEVKLLIKNEWIPVFMPCNLRVCVGQNIPDWPDKTWYNNVEIVKFIYRDGRTQDERPNPKDIVTIAAE